VGQDVTAPEILYLGVFATPSIQVAVNLDPMGFERTFVEALSGRAP
jgi:hypothetical protein